MAPKFRFFAGWQLMDAGCWLLGAPPEAARGAEPARPFGLRLGRELRSLRLVRLTG